MSTLCNGRKTMTYLPVILSVLALVSVIVVFYRTSANHSVLERIREHGQKQTMLLEPKNLVGAARDLVVGFDFPVNVDLVGGRFVRSSANDSEVLFPIYDVTAMSDGIFGFVEITSVTGLEGVEDGVYVTAVRLNQNR